MQQKQDNQQEMTTEQTMIEWKGEAEGAAEAEAEAEAEADRRTSSPHQQTPPLAPHAHITNITHTTSAFIFNDSGAASEAGSVKLAAEGGGKSGASVCSLSDAEGPRAHIAASDPLQIQIVLPTDEHAAAASADADSQQASRTESVSSAGVPPRAIPAALTGRSRRQSTVDSSRATASLQSYRSSHPLFDGRPYKEQQKAAKQFREELRSQASAAKSPALTAAPAASTNIVTSSSMMGSMRVEQQAPEQVHEQEDGQLNFRPRSSSLSSSDGDMEMHSEAQLSGHSTSPEPRSTPSISPRLLSASHRQETQGVAMLRPRATSRPSGSNRSGRGRGGAARGGGSGRGRSRARAQSRSRPKRKRHHSSDSESDDSSSDSSWYEEMPRSSYGRSRSNSGEPSSFTVMAQLVSPTPGPSCSTRSGRGSKRACQDLNDIDFDFDTRQHVPWQGKDVPLTAETVRSVEQATLVEAPAPAPSAASLLLTLASPPQSAFTQISAMPTNSNSSGNFLHSPMQAAPLLSPTFAYSLTAAFRPAQPLASPPPYAHFVQPSPPPLFYALTGQGNAATLVDARQSFSPPMLAPPLGSPQPQTPAAAAAASEVPSRVAPLASPPSLEFTAGLDLEAYATLPQAATYESASSLGASSSGSNSSVPSLDSASAGHSGRDSAMSSGFRGVSASPLRQLISPQEFLDPPQPDDYLSAPCVTPAQAIELLQCRASPQLLDSTFAYSAPCVFRPFDSERYRQYVSEQKRMLEERQAQA